VLLTKGTIKPGKAILFYTGYSINQYVAVFSSEDLLFAVALQQHRLSAVGCRL
jgi:hypothetical protein